MFRASTSKQFEQRARQQFFKKHQKGLQLDPCDLVFVTADNVQLLRPKDHSCSRLFTLMHVQRAGKVLDRWEAFRASRARQVAESTSDEILNAAFRPSNVEELTRLGDSLCVQWSVTLQWIDVFPNSKECRESKLSNKQPTTCRSLQQRSKLFAMAVAFN
jgi:hypothetical protein